MKLCLKAKYVSEDPAARLDYCERVGFTATQESVKSIPSARERGWPTAAELREHKKPFDDAGVQIAALEPVKEPLKTWVDGTPEGRESFEIFARHLDAAGEAGIPCVTLHPPLDNPATPDEEARQFEQNVRFYQRASARARQAGTRLATHSPYGVSGGGIGEKRLTKQLWGAREFGELFEAVPDPENGLIYCFGCMAMADDSWGKDVATNGSVSGSHIANGSGYTHGANGAASAGNALAEMHRFIDRTFFVHVRDVISYPDGSFDEVWPGNGTVNPEAAIRLLWQLGYRGPITPEHNPIIPGDGYSGPISTAYSAGWCNAILKQLEAGEKITHNGTAATALPLPA